MIILIIEVVTLKSETLRLSEDTKLLKETTNNSSSKLIGNELVILASVTPSTESLTIATTPHDMYTYNFPTLFEERIENMCVNKKLAEKPNQHNLNLRQRLKIKLMIPKLII